MAFCKNCGNKLDDGVQFCPKCGQTISGHTSTPVQNSEGEEEMKTWMKIFSILVWPVGAVLTIVAYSKKQMTLAKTTLIYTIIGLALAMVLQLLTSCGSSTNKLEKEVKKVMVEKARQSGQKMVISDFHLVHESGNNYTGIATCTLDGNKIDLEVKVVYDGSRFQAEWAPTAEYRYLLE